MTQNEPIRAAWEIIKTEKREIGTPVVAMRTLEHKGLHIGTEGVVKRRVRQGIYLVKFGGGTLALSEDEFEPVEDPGLKGRCQIYRFEFQRSLKGWEEPGGYREPPRYWQEYIYDPLMDCHIYRHSGQIPQDYHPGLLAAESCQLCGDKPVLVDEFDQIVRRVLWDPGVPTAPSGVLYLEQTTRPLIPQ